MAHVAPWKRERVAELTNMLTKHSVVGIVDIHGIPSPQMQLMRVNLRSKAKFTISKNKLMNLAFTEAAKTIPKIREMIQYIDGQCGIIVTNENPFSLYKILEGTKTKAPAKGGEVADEDIVLEAGETSFKPGPIVGELQRVGVPAAIDRGKVVIKKKKVLVKEGETISAEMASILTRLEILPIELGLDLLVAFEEGTIFQPEALHIDEKEYLDNLRLAIQHAFNLALHIGYITPVTIRPLLSKAQSQALALAVAGGIVTPATIEHLLKQSYHRMLALANKVPEACDDDLKDVLAGAAVSVPAAGVVEDQEETKEDEEEEEEEEASEEDGFAGLGTLFG